MLNGDNTLIVNNICESYGKKVNRKFRRLVSLGKLIIGLKYLGSLAIILFSTYTGIQFIKVGAYHYVETSAEIIFASMGMATTIMVVSRAYYRVMDLIFKFFIKRNDEKVKDLYSQIIIFDNITGLYEGFQKSSLNIVGLEEYRVKAQIDGFGDGKPANIPMVYTVKEGVVNEIAFFNDHILIYLDEDSRGLVEKTGNRKSPFESMDTLEDLDEKIWGSFVKSLSVDDEEEDDEIFDDEV